MLGIRQFCALAGLSALESIRQPICLLLTTSCVAAIGIAPMLIMHDFGEEGRLVRDSAMALHFIFGLFIAGYTACSSLTREMRNGTASVVLSKPVSRELFFLSKFAGMALVILAFSWCAGLATLLSERVAERYQEIGGFIGYIIDWQTGILLVSAPFAAFLGAGCLNYRWRRPFESTAFLLLMGALTAVFITVGFFDRLGRLQPFDLHVHWPIVPAGVLITLALLTLSALALALSTRMSTIPTLTLSGGLLFLGLISDHAFGRHLADRSIASVLYHLIPNWQHFWMPDALANGGVIPATYVVHVAGYALLCLAGMLMLGMASFRHAEVR